MTTTTCCEEKNCVPPRILSKEATHEILGENLGLLIAIGKNGEVVRFLPNGVEDTPATQLNVADEETTTLLEISIRVPKERDASNASALLMNTQSPNKALAYCICVQGGVRFIC